MGLDQRLSDLESAMKEYAKAEKSRIEKEVETLKAIRDGRGASGVRTANVEYASAVALNDLRKFLGG